MHTTAVRATGDIERDNILETRSCKSLLHASVFGLEIRAVLCAVYSFVQNSEMCLADVMNLNQWFYIKIET